jgi:DNA-binding NarL/FixJ family response regulator
VYQFKAMVVDKKANTMQETSANFALGGSAEGLHLSVSTEDIHIQVSLTPRDMEVLAQMALGIAKNEAAEEMLRKFLLAQGHV